MQNTYVDKLGLITLAQVMQHGSVIKICQVGHIISLLILGRIDLTDKVFLVVLGLIIDLSAKEKEKLQLIMVYWTYVDQFEVIALTQIGQHSRFVQICQVGHIVDFFEFRRIHLGYDILF